jgi:diamine N-acetyltransferase
VSIKIRLCSTLDLDLLQTILCETYDETFRKMNSPDTINQYLRASFNKEKLQTELNNPNCFFYFLFADDELAGYLKINLTPAQTDINDPESIELERIYVRKAYLGSGLGKRLMNYALQLTLDFNKKYIWLGVWDQNIKAIAFYKKMGFKEAGQHLFKMGEELQNDLIMKKIIIKD